MYLKLYLTPEAGRDRVTRLGPDKFGVEVRVKPVGNLANKRAIDLLANHLRVAPSQIRIVTGHHLPHKLVMINPNPPSAQ